MIKCGAKPYIKTGYCGYCTDKIYDNDFIEYNGIKFCNDRCKNEYIKQQEIKNNIIKLLDSLSPEERLEIFFDYCQNCGEKFENCICEKE